MQQINSDAQLKCKQTVSQSTHPNVGSDIIKWHPVHNELTRGLQHVHDVKTLCEFLSWSHYPLPHWTKNIFLAFIFRNILSTVTVYIMWKEHLYWMRHSRVYIRINQGGVWSCTRLEFCNAFADLLYRAKLCLHCAYRNSLFQRCFFSEDILLLLLHFQFDAKIIASLHKYY